MNYYVYVDCRQDGSVFYVGKGSGRRFLTTRSNNGWLSVVREEKGYMRVMVASGLSDDEAYLIEILLIDFYGVEHLTNLTAGGSGTVRRITTDKARQSYIGNVNSLGHKHTPDTRKKMAVSKLGNRNRGKQVTNTKTGTVYPSVTQAAKGTKYSRYTLSKMLNNLQRNDSNFKFI